MVFFSKDAGEQFQRVARVVARKAAIQHIRAPCIGHAQLTGPSVGGIGWTAESKLCDGIAKE